MRMGMNPLYTHSHTGCVLQQLFTAEFGSSPSHVVTEMVTDMSQYRTRPVARKAEKVEILQLASDGRVSTRSHKDLFIKSNDPDSAS